MFNSVMAACTQAAESPLMPNLQLLFICVGAIVCFFPLIGRTPSYLEDKPIREAVESALFRESSYAMLGCAVPLVADLGVDILKALMGRSSPDKKGIDGFGAMNLQEKFTFLCGIVVCPAVAMLPDTTDALALGYICASRAQLLLVGGCIVITASRGDRRIFNTPLTMLVLVSLWIANTMFGWSINFSQLSNGNVATSATGSEFRSDSGKTAYNVRQVMTILNWIAAITFILCCVRWLYSEVFVKVVTPWVMAHIRGTAVRQRRAKGDRESHAESLIWFPTLYIASSLIAIVVIGYDSEINFMELLQASDLVTTNTPFFFFEIMVAILALQLVKFEAVASLYELLDSKKTYVRYISHELRTPMNTAVLGLNMMLGELGRLNAAQLTAAEADRLETLTDINMACVTAVDILNDLLSFEKMESGIMELHTERVPALAFVGECFAMFEVHAKSKGIRVVSEWGPAHPVPTSAAAAALALRPCDEVVLDKFKLSQVLRNLMSNALKFTPPNGTVTVKAYFVADPTGGASAGPVTAGADGGGGGGTLAAIGRRLSHMATRRGSNMQSARILAAAAAAADAPKEGSGSDKVADDPGVPGFLVVDVVDTGAGISLENQQKLFKEIVQFQPEKLQAGGGSGLGLWITKGIVDMHGGRISVHSAGEGRGCTFTVRLPMYVAKDGSGGDGGGDKGQQRDGAATGAASSPSEAVSDAELGRAVVAAADAEEETKARASGGPGPALGMEPPAFPAHGGPTSAAADTAADAGAGTGALGPALTSAGCYNILVVDDSQLNRKMLVRVLRGRGHTCEEAEDGQQAVDVLRDAAPGRYDAVLMDFVMPRLDGPGATKQIRAHGYRGRIFGVTGNAMPSDVALFIAAGADEVLVKPLDLKRFHDIMAANTSSSSSAVPTDEFTLTRRNSTDF